MRAMLLRYTEGVMIPKIIFGLVIAANGVFGSFCMLPMQLALAETVPQHEEMNMSPMDAMSHADMEHGEDPQQPIACNGQCIAVQNDESAIGKSSAEHTVEQGIAFPVILNTTYVEVVQKRGVETLPRSPRELAIATVVIRQ